MSLQACEMSHKNAWSLGGINHLIVGENLTTAIRIGQRFPFYEIDGSLKQVFQFVLHVYQIKQIYAVVGKKRDKYIYITMSVEIAS